MAEYKRLPVTVCGQSFVLKTDENIDEIRELVQSVDGRLTEMRKEMPSLTPTKAAILLCLELQEALNKMDNDYQDLTEELDKIDLI